jgi:hypothetical protein
MGAHAPITALRAGGKCSDGIYGYFSLFSFAPIAALAAARAVGRGGRRTGSTGRNGRNRQQIPAGGRPRPLEPSVPMTDIFCQSSVAGYAAE